MKKFSTEKHGVPAQGLAAIEEANRESDRKKAAQQPPATTSVRQSLASLSPSRLHGFRHVTTRSSTGVSHYVRNFISSRAEEGSMSSAWRATLIACFCLWAGASAETDSKLSSFDLDDDFFSRAEDRTSYENNASESSILKIGRNPANGSAGDSPPIGTRDHLVNLLKVYNVGRIGRVWQQRNRQLSGGCRRHMQAFLEGLESYELWALKVLDASGRYSTGFFWGNNYWTGSETLCNNVGLQRRHYTSSGVVPSDSANFTVTDEEAPFTLGFFKIKAELHLPKNVAPMRSVLIGVCAPYSCNDKDIRVIINMSLSDGNNPNQTDVKILEVRTPHNTYYFWKDQTFWILLGVFLLVMVLLSIGTTYDVVREKRYEKVNQSRLPFTDNYLGSHNGKIGIGLSCSPKNTIQRDLEDAVGKFDDNSNALDPSEGSSVHSEPHLEIWQKILLSFSVKENVKTICYNAVSADTIPTIHGLRALSMAWVILGHTCIVLFKYSDNMEYRTVMEKEFFFQTVTNGAFSVDTFFFISGLLVSFLYFRTTAKIDVNRITGTEGVTSNVLQFLGLLGYRYGRLTAPYMFVLGVVQVSMKSFYYNSVFETPTLDHENCPKFWWRNALYINTLFPVKEMCMLWSWYLSDDTQFYILGSVLLILALSHLKAAAVLVFAFIISSWATTGYVAYTNNHMISQDDPLALFDKIYDKPWTRLGPYLIGMVIGWILFKTECKIKMRKFVVATGWLLSMLTMSTLVYGLYESDLDLLTSSAYSALSHSVWALGLAWIVVACSTGYGGFVNRLLSSSILYPFSRVTYCAYLVHPLIIRYMIINLDSPLHLNKEVVMFLFFGQIVASYITSFVISLAFEAPVVALLRILSPTKTSRSVG